MEDGPQQFVEPASIKKGLEPAEAFAVSFNRVEELWRWASCCARLTTGIVIQFRIEG